MLKQIAAAIGQEDYKTAAKLLKPLLKTEKNNPWVQFYVGRVQEGMGKRAEAERLYLKLLPQITNPKLMAQIRQGIRRIEQHHTNQQQDAIAQAVETPGGEEQGVLILEPIITYSAPRLDKINPKQAAAQAFAKVFKIDAYTARLQLPSRGWRLYRTGKIGELHYYVQALQSVNIPCFAVPIAQVPQLQIFTVHYFNALSPRPKVRCMNAEGKAGEMTFAWSEVQGRVLGRIPFFESVVTVDAKHRLTRKTQKQDHIAVCDLHLPSKGYILRLCERSYAFNRGIRLASEERSPIERDTVSQSWQYLMEQLTQRLKDIPTFAEFDTFASSALDCRELLGSLEPHLDLERREPSLWDGAFHLYSGLAYWRSRSVENHAESLH
ncbi:MAG: tetratricopeptide repeat protein [Spirulina sp. SIO3F2]|nr:tetratricopeptide repeat protein [Spirulina sp. SIO3F2]